MQDVADWRSIGKSPFGSSLRLLRVLRLALHLYFLRTVGIQQNNRFLEILATGLIIGGGTKPLHDLVTMISNA